MKCVLWGRSDLDCRWWLVKILITSSSRLVCREFFTPSAATCSTLPPPSNWCSTTSLTTSTGARRTSGGSPDTPTSPTARWLTGPPACWWVEPERWRDYPTSCFYNFQTTWLAGALLWSTAGGVWWCATKEYRPAESSKYIRPMIFV